jgi:hypothetical protein
VSYPIGIVEGVVCATMCGRGEEEQRLMTMPASTPEAEVQELTPEEGRALLDQAARYYLDMSAEEFLAAWDRGDFAAEPDRPEVARVAILLPFGR